MSDKTLYIVDAHAHIYASYYAIRALSSPGGEPTNAVYGFTSTLLALLRDRQPSALAVVFDAPGGTFRDKIYPGYKATRQPMPEDLPGQIKRIHQVIEALGVAKLSVAGVEADDVIATLARAGAADGYQVFICSKDKDLEQIIGDGIVLFDKKGPQERVVDAAALAAEKGYRPGQAVDIQSLTGDSVDNVPGVPGVGPKTAAKLLAEYDTLDNLLAHADKIPGKVGESIRASADAIQLARRLVRLRDDVELPVELADLHPGRPDKARLAELFTELGFKGFLSQLELAAEAKAVAVERGATSAGDCEYVGIDTAEKLARFAAELAGQKEFAVDTETTGLDSLHCELVGFSFAWQDAKAYYVPVQSPKGGGFGLPLALAVGRLKPILEDPGIAKIGHHMKFDYEAMGCAGITMAPLTFDTMIASYLLDPESGDHKLDSLAHSLLNHKTIPISDLIGKGKDQISMRDVPLDRITTYAAEDADITWRVCGQLRPKLKEAGLLDLLGDLEMPLVAVLAEMEANGVSLDLELLAKMSGQMAHEAAELTKKIYKAAGGEFNIDSTQQLAKVLFDTLKLPSGRKTKTGYSTDVEVLEQLAGKHAVPRLVLEYRQLVKLKGTYVDALPRMVNPQTGRVHPTFTQTRAATGRLACQDPNLQNIPIRTKIGRQIRQAFVPGEPGNVMLTADYSQIELRMLAHFSRDPAMMRAFAEDQDIHTFVASQVFNVLPELVDAEQRQRAKAVSFGIIYGQTPYGLAKALNISQTDAADFIDAYFERYKTVRQFLDRCVEQARKHGFVTTILGRRRWIPDIDSQNKMQRALAERTAINTVTQGSAADLIKRAMLNIHRRIHDENRPARMLIQVHDELVFELPAATVEADAEMIRREMTGALKLDVPLKVDVAWGKSWLEAK